MKLTVAYFYPELLNLYGDNGNVEIIATRAYKRGFEADVVRVNPSDTIDSAFMREVNFIFMGGGPDSSQKDMAEDLKINKGPYIKEYIENGGISLFVCGSYQLMGKYYKAADGTIVDGLSVFDFYTQHFGHTKPRCVGNAVCRLSASIISDPVFGAVNRVGEELVGFENHGGRTFLDASLTPLGTVVSGFGNNGQDGLEGLYYKNTLGTYLHGPLFSKNPHLCDFLLAKSLKVDTLKELDDRLIISAHTASKKLKR